MMTDLNKGVPALFFTPIFCVHSLLVLIPVKYRAMGFDAEFHPASCVSSVMEFLLRILMKDFGWAMSNMQVP